MPYKSEAAKEYHERYRSQHREKARQYAAEYRRKNPDKCRANDRTRYPKRKEQSRNWHYQRKYGITLAEYEQMVVAQCGACAICGETPCEDPAKANGKSAGRLVLDHDHQTGAIRGVICSDCNLALGLFRDCPDLLRHAVDYLEVKANTSLWHSFAREITIAKIAITMGAHLTTLSRGPVFHLPR